MSCIKSKPSKLAPPFCAIPSIFTQKCLEASWKQHNPGKIIKKWSLLFGGICPKREQSVLCEVSSPEGLPGLELYPWPPLEFSPKQDFIVPVHYKDHMQGWKSPEVSKKITDLPGLAAFFSGHESTLLQWTKNYWGYWDAGSISKSKQGERVYKYFQQHDDMFCYWKSDWSF